MTGLHVAPTAPWRIELASSSHDAESFQRHVAVVWVIWWSGLIQLVLVLVPGIAPPLGRCVVSRQRTGGASPKSRQARPARSRVSGMPTTRLTTAQALIKFLKNQYVERDGRENRFFEG